MVGGRWEDKGGEKGVEEEEERGGGRRKGEEGKEKTRERWSRDGEGGLKRGGENVAHKDEHNQKDDSNAGNYINNDNEK